VYNIEVHGEHVYQVGDLGVLVHNACSHMHHSIPVLIRRLLARAGNPAAYHPNVVGHAGLPNRIPLPDNVHRAIHGGTGYVQSGGIRGGHYNNLFHQLIMRNGGYGNIPTSDIVRIRELLVNWFEL
jgi:hypothetical protein